MRHRKKLGIVGGMGSVAAGYFFKRLIELTPAKTDQEYIEAFVHNNTRVPDRTRGILHGGDSPLQELKRSVSLLNSVGVDYILFACMTSHYFIESLRRESRAELIDAVEETARAVRNRYPHVKKVGILASTGAIKVGVFQDKFKAFGIDTVILNDEDQVACFMEPIYEDWGIKAGNRGERISERFRQGMRILQSQGADVIVAGCSELPLAIGPADSPLPLIDSIDAVLESAIERCLGVPALSTLPIRSADVPGIPSHQESPRC